MIFVRIYDSFWEGRGDIQWLSKPCYGNLMYFMHCPEGSSLYLSSANLSDFIPAAAEFHREMDISLTYITLFGIVETIRYRSISSLSDILNEVKPAYVQ